jgi:hypothetical protein
MWGAARDRIRRACAEPIEHEIVEGVGTDVAFREAPVSPPGFDRVVVAAVSWLGWW